jgi:mRNA-degrading endonuclease RelE of RelBE toxin-antitoxin system
VHFAAGRHDCVFHAPFSQTISKPFDEHQAESDKQLAFLLSNLRHPSLRAKKYDEANDIWQARVDDGYRFYFQIDGETYILLSIIPHPK